MKFAFPLLATLAVVAASPVANTLDIRDQSEGDTQVPIAVDGKCDDGWSVFQDNGNSLCCPPGQICDEGGMRPAPNDDVRVQQSLRICHWTRIRCYPTYCIYRRDWCIWV